MEIFLQYIDQILSNSGIEDSFLPLSKAVILFFVLFAISWISLLVTKGVFVRMIHKVIVRTEATWDDVFIENKVFSRIAHIVPAIFVKIMAPAFFNEFTAFEVLIIKITDIYIIIVVTMVILAFIRSVETIAIKWTSYNDQPVHSYMQVARIILYIVAGILILSVIMGQSPLYFLSAFGAMTAIFLLVFRDTILGLVASVQMSAHDTVRVGDWVEMPKFNADGDVIEITLNTVKIQNWDRTITSVPTHYFMSDSFKNWRGMSQGGGRRIKRSIFINLRSVKFVDPEMRERLKGVDLIRDYVTQRQAEIEKYNQEKNVNIKELINGRRMTNLGVFRQYALAYLKNHPRIHQEMIMMVRQLDHEDHGVPIEIYCFTATTAWVDYENIQSDIFDHLFAAASVFDLEIFQIPSGNDVVLLGEKLIVKK